MNCICDNCVKPEICQLKRVINQYNAVVQQNRELQKDIHKYKNEITKQRKSIELYKNKYNQIELERDTDQWYQTARKHAKRIIELGKMNKFKGQG